ncbi:MAG TPA: hypothetical protein PLJ60_19820 [Chryseolinea sp.]|mgnify:FL=1|nr:hypothetical protein [Chryseolinea sp.]HPM32592.1 hypothetical protein [Chryseolinea sp.]
MKAIVTSILTITILISCSKEEPSSAMPIEESCLLTKVTSEFTSVAEHTIITTEYSYDPDDFLIRVNTTTEINRPSSPSSLTEYISTYTYSNGMVSAAETSTTAYIQSTVWTNENEKVKKVEGTLTWIGSDPIQLETTLYYGDDNMLDSLHRLTSNDFNMTQNYTFNSNKNFESWDVYFNSELNGHFVFSDYDNKNNPFKLLAKAIAQPQFHTTDGVTSDSYVSENNPGKIEVTGLNESTSTYTYEYNSTNYPTKIIRIDGKGVTTTTLLEYTSCTAKK